MSIREAIAIESSQGTIFAYGPVYGMQPAPATITTPGANYSFTQPEARILAAAIAPDLAPEQVKEDLTKPYQDKAAAALAELQETITSWTGDLNAARLSGDEDWDVLGTLESLLLALSAPVVALKELAEGNL